MGQGRSNCPSSILQKVEEGTERGLGFKLGHCCECFLLHEDLHAPVVVGERAEPRLAGFVSIVLHPDARAQGFGLEGDEFLPVLRAKDGSALIGVGSGVGTAGHVASEQFFGLVSIHGKSIAWTGSRLGCSPRLWLLHPAKRLPPPKMGKGESHGAESTFGRLNGPSRYEKSMLACRTEGEKMYRTRRAPVAGALRGPYNPHMTFV
jgi:hypothetical protein